MNFSFLYDGIRYDESNLKKIQTVCTTQSTYSETKTVYELDNLLITRIVKKYSDSIENAVTYYENQSETCSKILSDILDADDKNELFSDSPKPGFTAYGKSGYVTLYDWKGSGIGCDDFAEESTVLDSRPVGFLARTGRSSEINLPFFNLDCDGTGYIYAIGWTGRWQADFQKDESAKTTNVKIGIYGTSFYLKPHEKIRTASVLRSRYKDGRINGYNTFKRVIKDCIVLNRIKEKPLPFWVSFWGGSTSEFMIHRLNELKQNQFDFDCFWIDAGWYGDYDEYCPSEFYPAWGNQVGNWFPNTKIHPNQLRDVAEQAHKNGMSFMLWFEPERADTHSRLFNEHRNWFLHRKDSDCNVLINLGEDEPRNYTIELISNAIVTLNMDIYRQDFNVDSVYYWEENDPPQRNGMTEIKYVMGLYTFWDTLLERFPHLIIDNCASGGKRIDLETIRRSVPFWRSDYQCLFDRDAEALQCHNTGISVFVPFSGSGVGQIINDKYRRRSCYSSTMGGNFIGYEDISIDSLNENIRPAIAEFKSVREYFSCDFYPLFGYSVSHNCWGGYQYDRPEQQDGIILAFRRDECPLDRAVVQLGGIQADKSYQFTDADSGLTQTISGKELIENGYAIIIDKRRDSRLIRYKETGRKNS